MDESVICIEDQNEVIDLSETVNGLEENSRNNVITKRRTRSVKRKQPVHFVDLSTEPDFDTNELSSEKSATPKSRTSSDLSCPICFERLLNVSAVKTTICGHVFCSSCIESVVKEKKGCPKCRRKLTMKNLIPLYL